VRKPVGFGPNGASFRSPPAVESEAETNFHVPTILILDSSHVSAIQDSHQSFNNASAALWQQPYNLVSGLPTIRSGCKIEW
jgi:hypothetical protein